MSPDYTSAELDELAMFASEISATSAAVAVVALSVPLAGEAVAGPAAAISTYAGDLSFLLGAASIGYSATHGEVYVGDGRVFLSGAMGESLATLGLATALSPPVLAGPRCEGPWGPLGWAPAS
jgi:hypothetical protein